MIKYKIENVESKILQSIVCEVCKKEYFYDKDVMEVQEFHHIRLVGGYGSIFGDGVSIKCDICQKCLDEKLGEWLVRGEEDV